MQSNLSLCTVIGNFEMSTASKRNKQSPRIIRSDDGFSAVVHNLVELQIIEK